MSLGAAASAIAAGDASALTCLRKCHKEVSYCLSVCIAFAFACGDVCQCTDSRDLLTPHTQYIKSKIYPEKYNPEFFSYLVTNFNKKIPNIRPD